MSQRRGSTRRHWVESESLEEAMPRLADWATQFPRLRPQGEPYAMEHWGKRGWEQRFIVVRKRRIDPDS